MTTDNRDLVTRLRRRGDRLSLEAAAVIEQLRADSASARTATRRRMSAAVQAGMLKARREGRQVGGFNPESARRVAEAQEFAEKLRPVIGELANLSARQVAAVDPAQDRDAGGRQLASDDGSSASQAARAVRSAAVGPSIHAPALGPPARLGGL